MFRNLQKNVLILLIGLIFTGVNLSAQTPDETSKKVNFRYSQNPKIKAKKDEKGQKQESESTGTENKSAVAEKVAENKPKAEIKPAENLSEGVNDSEPESRSIAAKTLEIARRGVKTNASPTEIYKVGVGDILFVNLQNAPSESATYFTVLNDGTIDYPLSAATVFVQGLTTDEIEELLEERIKIVENPQIAVRVREHASHSISVIGLVEKPGVKLLQREAVPLFVVRAEAIVKANANRVIIRRANTGTETFDLNNESYENVLIFPGDIVEFLRYEKSDNASIVPQFYYIGGNIRAVGQRDFYPGITLSQAILASGGLRKAKESKVVVRRKNNEGLLESTVFDLNEIKEGKIPDPALQAGDTIEVGN